MTSSLPRKLPTTARFLPTWRSAAVSTLLALGLSCIPSALAISQEPNKPVIPPAPSPTGQDNRPLSDDSIRYLLPKKEQLFRIESEVSLFERIRHEKAAESAQPAEFPEEKHLKGSLPVRNFQAMSATEFPFYVVFQPLYFQQINAERYGWELGVFQPAVSAAQFYGDVLIFPYKFAVQPPWCCESNAGYVLPGNPESLRLLTVPFSWRGVAGQAGAAVGGAAIFP